MSKLNVKLTPLKGITSLNLTSGFGYRKFTYKGKVYEGQHNGLDLTPASEIVAIVKGKVTSVRTSVKGYDAKYPAGNYVTLQHGSGFYTSYNHLVFGSVKVKVGDIVEAGTVLGSTVGQTTGDSTGPHLHFAVKLNGSYVDPTSYLLGTAVIPAFYVAPVVVKPPVVVAPVIVTGLQVGDRVQIIHSGNGSSYGGRNRAFGIGWIRYVTKIYAGRPFPYQVGNKGLTSGANTTGFYNAADLKKV